jgi:hypothetical protein
MMKLFTKIAISTIALAGMLQADVTLIGVDGGLTVLNARVGFNAGLTVGKAHHSKCPTAYTTVSTSRTYTSDPCSYVCGPCVVVEPPCPKPAPKPVCCPCDPCAK